MKTTLGVGVSVLSALAARVFRGSVTAPGPILPILL